MKSVACLAILTLLTGCFEVEQSLEINKDLSGKAGFHIGIDFEPMVTIMVVMKRSMEGKEGPPTNEEIATARKEFVEKSKEEPGGGEVTAEERARIEESLPEGVTLADLRVEKKEMGVATDFAFAFDKLSKLSEIVLPAKEGAGPDEQNVIDKPFDGMVVVDDGKTITITSKPQNPSSKVEEQTNEGGAPADPEMEKLMKDAFKGLKVGWRITAPFEVIETNAMRRDGKTLIWEYDIESLEKLEKSGKPAEMAIRVKYRK